MIRKVPFETVYDQIRRFEKVAFKCLIISAILTFVNWLLPEQIESINMAIFESIKTKLKGLSYAAMVVYLLTNLYVKISFHIVEKRKRNDLIDNSFGTKYSDDNTEGYYNNSEISPGIKKLALNSYESSFHTENTLKLMLYKNFLKLIPFGIPFLLSVFSKDGSSVILLLFECSIPLILFGEFVIMMVYYLNVMHINTIFKIELTNIGNKELKQNEIAQLLIPIMEYYSIKAWANINLDSKIFLDNNDKISKKWNSRKETLKVK